MASASASLATAKVEGVSLLAELANCDAVAKAVVEREAAKEAARLIEKETVVAAEVAREVVRAEVAARAEMDTSTALTEAYGQRERAEELAKAACEREEGVGVAAFVERCMLQVNR